MSIDRPLFYVFSDNDGDISIERYFAFLYEKIPNIYNINLTIDLHKILKKLQHKFKFNDSDFILKLEQASKDNLLKVDYNKSAYLIKIAEEILLFISANKTSIYYSNEVQFQTIKDIIKILKPKSTPIATANHCFLLKYEDNDYNLRPFEIKKTNIDFDLFYNNDFKDFHQKVEQFLNNPDAKGIILLYGKPGTGKTTYLKHLFSTNKNKFIIVPRKMFNALESPNFYFFISEIPNSVIVLEDCDQILTTHNKTSAITEFLKNAEGLFANDYNYKIICTLSAHENQMNIALINKSPNILKYHLKELPIDKANKLREKLKLSGKTNKPLVLSDALKPKLENLRKRRLGFDTNS